MLSNNSWYCNEAIYQIPLQDRNFDSFQPNYPKKMFCGQKHTNQHCHQIWHIQNSLATNFRLKQKMLIFWTKFATERSVLRPKYKTLPSLFNSILQITLWSQDSPMWNTFVFFDQIFLKGIFLIQNKK